MVEDTRSRVQISEAELNEGLRHLREKLVERLTKKGYGTMASCHEILGVLTEEMRELESAIHKDIGIAEELLDIAVGAIFGYVCVINERTDW